jgi:hypothetical protein
MNMSIMSPAQATAFSGNTGATPDAVTTVNFYRTGTDKMLSQTVFIKNTHASQTLSVSFDADVSFYDLASGESVTVDVARYSIRVKSSGASTTFKGLVTG